MLVAGDRRLPPIVSDLAPKVPTLGDRSDRPLSVTTEPCEQTHAISPKLEELALCLILGLA
jgi:hypothetical protein